MVDLGEVALLPGLINAHCHLDYTHMAGQIAPPKLFTEWLTLITETKGGWSHEDYAASWREGAEMLLRTGTTTVGDIEARPQLLPAAWHSTPLRMVSFLELIGITSRRAPETVLSEAVEQLNRLSGSDCRVGLSPHAPYSTVPRLLELASQVARRRRFRTCVHVGESALEYAMFSQGAGPMFDWLQRSGRDMSDCGLGSPVEHLERSGILNNRLLVAHANYLGPKDPAILGKQCVHVVHCPRSHFYFKHDPFPLQSLTRAGVNICLGTDSLASVYKSRKETVVLDMFDEMRAFHRSQPLVPPKTVLRMATVNGAHALGLEGSIGELVPGAFADMIAVPMESGRGPLIEAILEHKGNVEASMINGRWALPPSCFDLQVGTRGSHVRSR